jgi:hypothetical protein
MHIKRDHLGRAEIVDGEVRQPMLRRSSGVTISVRRPVGNDPKIGSFIAIIRDPGGMESYSGETPERALANLLYSKTYEGGPLTVREVKLDLSSQDAKAMFPGRFVGA